MQLTAPARATRTSSATRRAWIAAHRTRWWRWIVQLLPLRQPRRLPRTDQPQGWTDADWRSLRGLGVQTLRDIGAPDWVQAHRSAAERSAWDQLLR